MAAGAGRGGGSGRAAGAFLRRRAAGAPRHLPPDRARGEARPLHQPDHVGHSPGQSGCRSSRRCRPGARAAQRPGHGDRRRRVHRRAGRRARAQAPRRRGDRRRRAGADPQRRRPPRQRGAHRRLHRPRAGAGRAPAGGRPCPVLRLGAAQPGSADADPGAGSRRHPPGGDGAGAPQGRPCHRLRRPRLLRPAAQGLHGRLGPAVHGDRPGGASPALPRRDHHPRACLRQRPRRGLGRHLAALAGVQRLPWHRLDGRALPELRPARARLGRLPLPGAGAHRRCGGDRSRLPPLAAPCTHGGGGGARRRDEGGDAPPVYRGRGRGTQAAKVGTERKVERACSGS